MTAHVRPDYGLDAPNVVRNLLLAAAAGFAVWASAGLGFWSGRWLGIPVAYTGLVCCASFSATAMAMLWYSRIGKLRAREALLDLVPWNGTETVLDVGCGRGLMLVGAARRLTSGKAVGVDIWQATDLTGNHPEATRENARREGVLDRVAVETADMRQLPFPDGSFDCVLSCAAIHNLYDAKDRAQAIREIVRVLRPGGRAVISDIRHLADYADVFKTTGLRVERVGTRWRSLLMALVTMGALRPGKVIAQKPAVPEAPSS